MLKGEILHRFNILNDMITQKFSERPTYEFYNKNKQETQLRMGALKDSIDMNQESIDKL